MTAPCPSAAEIAALHAACRDRLDSRLPTHLRRADYHEALCLADAAVQLAVEAALDAEVVARCERLQQRCEDVLRGWYSVRDERERDTYARRARAARPSGTGPMLGRRHSVPKMKSSSVWWSERVAVIGKEQHAANFALPGRWSMITSLRARLSVATGISYKSR